MKSIPRRALMFVALAILCSNVFGQDNGSEGQTRPRTVSQLTQKPANAPAPQTTTPGSAAPIKEAIKPESNSIASPLALTPSLIQSRIGEAERLLKSRPLHTA